MGPAVTFRALQQYLYPLYHTHPAHFCWHITISQGVRCGRGTDRHTKQWKSILSIIYIAYVSGSSCHQNVEGQHPGEEEGRREPWELHCKVQKTQITHGGNNQNALKTHHTLLCSFFSSYDGKAVKALKLCCPSLTSTYSPVITLHFNLI